MFLGVSLVAQTVKNPSAMRETWVRSLGWKDPLEQGMATHSSILACQIPWTEEPGGLQSTGSQRVGHGVTNSTAYYSKGFSSKKKKKNTKITCVELKYELKGKEGK